MLAAGRMMLLGIAIPLLAIALCGPVTAGVNTGGSAWLSAPNADGNGALTNFPILVHLGGVRDVKELAISLKWYPYDPTGDCYRFVSAPRSAEEGWALEEHPGAAFNG